MVKPFVINYRRSMYKGSLYPSKCFATLETVSCALTKKRIGLKNSLRVCRKQPAPKPISELMWSRHFILIYCLFLGPDGALVPVQLQLHGCDQVIEPTLALSYDLSIPTPWLTVFSGKGLRKRSFAALLFACVHLLYHLFSSLLLSSSPFVLFTCLLFLLLPPVSDFLFFPFLVFFSSPKTLSSLAARVAETI